MMMLVNQTKKTLKLIAIVAVSFSVLNACKDSFKHDNINLMQTSTNSSNLSEILDFEKAIVLKNLKDIGQEAKVIVTNQNIIVADIGYSERVFFLKLDGKIEFILEPGIGGPDEYTKLSDISYDFGDNIFYIFSEDQNRILGYDDKGNLIKNFKIDSEFYVHEFEILKDETFVFYADQDKNGKLQVNVYDFKKNKLVKSFLRNSFEYLFMGNENSLWKNQDNCEIIIAPYFSNYIYYINDRLKVDSIYIKNSLKIDKSLANIQDYKKLINYTMKHNQNYYVGMHKENNSFRSFLSMEGDSRQGKSYLENKLNGNIINTEIIKNDISRTDIGLNIAYLNNTNLYTLTSSEEFKFTTETIKYLQDYFQDVDNGFFKNEEYMILNIYSIKN